MPFTQEVYIYRPWFRAGYSYSILSNKKPQKEKVFDKKCKWHCELFIFQNWSKSKKKIKQCAYFLKIYKLKKGKEICLNTICPYITSYGGQSKLKRFHCFFFSMVFDFNGVIFELIDLILFYMIHSVCWISVHPIWNVFYNIIPE